jgi:hypothetical protein
LSLSIGGSSSLIGDLLRRRWERSGDGLLRLRFSPFGSASLSTLGTSTLSAWLLCISSSVASKLSTSVPQRDFRDLGSSYKYMDVFNVSITL